MIPAGYCLIIDESSCQGKVDHDAVRAWVGPDGERVEGVITKATEGNADAADPQFARNWSEIARVGFVRGAYHFAHPDQRAGDARDEAERFVRQIEAAGGVRPGLDLVALDLENATQIPPGEPFVRWCADHLDHLDELTGINSGCYIGGPFFAEHAGKSVSSELLERLRRHWHWLAAYVGDPTKFVALPWQGDPGWSIWQESGDVAPPGQTILHVAGIGGGQVNVDRDFFRGDGAALRAWVASLDLTRERTPFTPPAGAAHSIGQADRAEAEAAEAEKR